MADSAPLTSAHTHARNAAEEVSKAHRKEASRQHQHASSDFSRAARTTSDSEALRVLKLLEDQHQKLARILQIEEFIPNEADEDVKSSTSGARGGDSRSPADKKAVSPNHVIPAKAKTSSNKTTSRIGSQIRDSSPSLARDIASRRGIPPPGRATAASHERSRQVSPESTRMRQSSHLGTSPKVPPSIIDSQANLKETRRASKLEADEGFAKFYNNLTTGTMSKLSSALAYAGLPLTADDIKADQVTTSTNKRTVTASNEPDVNKYISKAALDAVEDEHRQRGTFGHGFGPAESFYVVQTGGGTYSYADIAKAKQGRLSGIDEYDEESFVDARELREPTSPNDTRASKQNHGTFGKGRTPEELELENSTLKSTIDHLAHRLANFEAHAQDASMAALTQSMINVRPPQIENGPAMQERLRLLEKQVEQQAEERQQLEDRASKQAKMLKKYHSKWEEIKNSAKEKDRAKKEKSDKGGIGDEPFVGEPDIS